MRMVVNGIMLEDSSVCKQLTVDGVDCFDMLIKAMNSEEYIIL